MKVKKLLFGGVIASAMVLGLMSLSINKKAVTAEAIISAADVSVNGVTFDSGTNYYKNSDVSDCSGSALDYNAYFDPSISTLELKNFEGELVLVDSAEPVNIKLTGDNIINASSTNNIAALSSNGGMIIKGDGSLTINVTKSTSIGSAFGVKSGDYLTIQEDVTLIVNMTEVTEGSYYALSGQTYLGIEGNSTVTIDMAPTADQGFYTYGLYTNAGEIRHTSTKSLDINVDVESGIDNFAIYNHGNDPLEADNGNIFFGGSGKVTLTQTGSGYCQGIVSAQNAGKNTSGVITFDGVDADVEINGFDYPVNNRSDERAVAGGDYDIYINDGATLSINTSADTCSDGLFSLHNGVLIDGSNYNYEGTGCPVNVGYSGSLGGNHSEYGFDVKNNSKVILKTSSFIQTNNTAISDIDLTGNGSFVYSSLEGTAPRFEGTYNIRLGASTREARPMRLRKLTGSCPDGTFNLGGWSGYSEYPVEFKAFVAPLATEITIDDGKPFSDTNLYFVNDAAGTTSDPTDYNAKFDKDAGILYLKGYSGKTIYFSNSSGATLRIIVESQSSINGTGYGIDVRGAGASLEITTKDTNSRRLYVTGTREDGSKDARGIGIANGSLIISGAVEVNSTGVIAGTATGNAFGVDVSYQVSGYPVLIEDHAGLSAYATSSYASGNDAALHVLGKVTFDTLFYVNYVDCYFDASECAGNSYGIYANLFDFGRYNSIRFAWHGNGGSYGAVNRMVDLNNVTNGCLNINNINSTAHLVFGSPVYNLEVRNGVDLSNEGQGNYVDGAVASLEAFEIDDVPFARWTKTGSSIFADETNPNSTVTLKSNEIVTAEYDFVTRQPVFDTRGSNTTGYLRFALKGSPTAIVVVSASSLLVAYNSNPVTQELAFTDGDLGDGEYRLRAQYTTTDSHTVYLYTDPFTVNHSAFAVEWNVTYHAGAGTGENYVVSTHGSYNLSDFASTGLIAPEGKRFLKWAIGSEGGEQFSAGYSSTVIDHVDYYAVYENIPSYTMNFIGGANVTGGSMSNQVRLEGQDFELPESTFEHATHTAFDYWDVGGVHYDAGDTIVANDNLTATAVYTLLTQYTLTFNHGDGTGSMDEIVKYSDENFVLPASTFAAPENFEFSHWEVGGVEKHPGDTIPASADMEAVAKFVRIQVTISFNAGEGSGAMADVPHGKGTNYVLPTPTFTAPAHKEFKCWSIGGVEYKVGDPYLVNSDITIVAVYKDIAVNISVEVEGGSGTQVISGTDGGQVVLPECTLTAPEGKQFDGWIVDGVKHEAGESVTINVDSTIKAAWKDIPVEPETPTNPDTPATPDTPTTPTTPENPPKKGLSGGAIAGIVIASVVVVGVGGFALTWFVILKKTFADFLAIFKKK